MSELNNFTRFFKNVKQCKELNWQEKALLSEMISYQLEGMPFKVKDKTLAVEVAMDKGSVSKFVNQLHKREVIDKTVESFASPSGGKPKRLRTITVRDIDMWTKPNRKPVVKALELSLKKKKATEASTSTDSTNEHSNTGSTIQAVSATIPTQIQAEPKELEIDVKAPTQPKAEAKSISQIKQNKVSDSTESNRLIISPKDITDAHWQKSILLSLIQKGEAVKFIKVNIKRGDNLIPDEATYLPHLSQYFLKSKLELPDSSGM
jgi:hypothetical protein